MGVGAYFVCICLKGRWCTFYYFVIFDLIFYETVVAWRDLIVIFPFRDAFHRVVSQFGSFTFNSDSPHIGCQFIDAVDNRRVLAAHAAMFSYGQKQVEMILAFVEGRCIIGYSHFTSGSESTVVRFYLDCSRTFGNCSYNAIFYCSDIRVRTAPSDSCNSCIFRNDSRSQCSCSSCF